MSALQELLGRVIDYAGLFPPARLSMPEAIQSYAHYRQEPESWMLSRFICPASRLTELERFAGLFAEQPPFHFSALGRGGETLVDCLNTLQEDLRDIAAFRERHPQQVEVDMLEVRLPTEVGSSSSSESVARYIQTLLEVMESSGPPSLSVFFEVTPGSDPRPTATNAIERLALCQPSGTARLKQVGFKLRCGGQEPHAFPSAETIASVLTSCSVHDLPLKMTAGLHHPIRHFSQEAQAPMHGFVNVLGASVLGMAHGLSEQDRVPILLDEDASHFRIDEEGFAWNDLRATTQQIRDARASGLISYGSCSFDEPREDLRAMGWL